MESRLPRLDVLAAALLTGLAVVDAGLGLTVRPDPWLLAAAASLVTLPVATRSLYPAGSLAVLLTALVAQAALGSEAGGGFAEPVALVLVVYSVGARLGLRASMGATAVTAAATAGVVVLGEGAHVGNVVYATTLVFAAWFAGRGVRLAHERSELLAERRALQERGRIARELHDVVSHNVSAIVIQAGAQRRELASSSAEARTLADIEGHARQTLQELRRLLGVLRLDDDGAAPLAPQPGLSDLPELLAATRLTGIDVAMTSSGEPVPIGDGLELTIYRLVQESLTNIRKHAQTSTAEVRLSWRPEEVCVEVLDLAHQPGLRPRAVPGAGFGLRAMAERVAAYGGRLTAAPTDRGFRVAAVLPIGDAG